MSKRTLSYGIVAVILITAWVYFVYRPLQSRSALTQARMKQVTQEISEAEKTIAGVPAFLEAHSDLLTDRRQQEQYLFGKEELLHLIDLLEGIATENGLEVIEITPSVEELLRLSRNLDQQDQPLYLNLSLRMRGGFVDLGRYVTYLETTGFFRGFNRCLVMTNEDAASGLDLIVGFKALLREPTEAS